MKKGVILFSFLIVLAASIWFAFHKRRPELPRVLVIGFDGASWNLMGPPLRAGKLPHFQKLIEEGSSAHLTTLTPTWSPLLWTSIATGKRPDKHGINAIRAEDGTVEVESDRGRTTKAFWNILTDRKIPVGVVNWWLTWPAEKVDGFIVSDKYRRTRKAEGLTYPPELVKTLPKVGLNFDAFEQDKRAYALPVSLQPTEIVDGTKRMNYKVYWGQDKAVFQASDALLKQHNVQVFVTLFRIIDISSHLFNELPEKQNQNDANYSKLLEPIYIYADQILGELMDAAGPQARIIICSDHGFQRMDGKYDHNARENPPAGILILHGPEFRKNYQLSRASILDVTPTLLYLLNQPVGKDMDGSVLLDAFTEETQSQRKVQFIATYDGKQIPGNKPGMEMDPETKEDFKTLGYIH